MHEGRPVINPAPNISASNAVDRVQHRRARLIGLDAPQPGVVEVITQEAVHAEIEWLNKMMAELDAVENGSLS